MRKMSKIMPVVSANGLPTTNADQRFGFVLKKRGFRAIGETDREVRNIRLVSSFGDVSIF